MALRDRIRGLWGLFRRTERETVRRSRGQVNHVILLDGMMSELETGFETNVGLIYKALDSVAEERDTSIYYEAGVQWTDWSATLDVIEGRGINRQIRRAYGWLASHYRPGDQIFLIGYSRGAYAVRSLGGVIDRIGLLKREQASERMIREVYRHYQYDTDPATCAAFRQAHCHDKTPIEAVAVFDTVKALGFRAPFVWKWEDVKHAFHNHRLGPSILNGYHALALDETRAAFKPVLWNTTDRSEGEVHQVWFRGGHGDIGGQLGGYHPARHLSNIPLVWMLDQLETCGLPLPDNWRSEIQTDPDAKAVGTWRGWSKYFLARKPRSILLDPSERIHATAVGRTPRANELDTEIIADN